MTLNSGIKMVAKRFFRLSENQELPIHPNDNLTELKAELSRLQITRIMLEEFYRSCDTLGLEVAKGMSLQEFFLLY